MVACMLRLTLAAFFVIVVAPSVVAQEDAIMPNPIEAPDENQPTPDQVTLGKILFWEEQLSFDNTLACGTCHRPEAGGSDPRAFKGSHPGPDGLFGVFLTDDDVAGSPSAVSADADTGFLHEESFFPAPQATPRKAPTVYNLHATDLNWDGEFSGPFDDPVTGESVINFGGSIEAAIADAINDPVQMGALNWGWVDVQSKLASVKPMLLATDLPPDMDAFVTANNTYPKMFQAVYGSPDVTATRAIFAIANYLRTQVTDQTLFDIEVLNSGSFTDPGLEDGLTLFKEEGNCTSCHVFPFLSDTNFHNIGVRPDAEDIGREAVTGQAEDRGKFRTPNARNSLLRGTLFHNGGVANVTELIDFYDEQVNKFEGPNMDPEIFNLYLTQAERLALVRLIEEGMTDPRLATAQPPFDHPTLRSDLPASNTVFGVPSLSGTGTTMTLIAHVPANIGHPNWMLGVDDATPNQGAILALSMSAADGSPFPDPAFPIPMNIGFPIVQMLPTATDAFGVATIQLPINKNAALQGQKMYGQFFVSDPGAVATGGLYGSEGVEIEFL